MNLIFTTLFSYLIEYLRRNSRNLINIYDFILVIN